MDDLDFPVITIDQSLDVVHEPKHRFYPMSFDWRLPTKSAHCVYPLQEDISRSIPFYKVSLSDLNDSYDKFLKS